MSGRKWTPHNEVIPANRFHKYDKDTGTFVGYFSTLSQRHGHKWNTLITIRNEKTGGEVVFEFYQTNHDKGVWHHQIFKSISKEHPNLHLVILNE